MKYIFNAYELKNTWSIKASRLDGHSKSHAGKQVKAAKIHLTTPKELSTPQSHF